MEIRLFRTSLRTPKQVQQISGELNRILNDRNWNFDLEDCDKVLRIEATDIPLTKIRDLMTDYQQSISEIF